MSAQASDGAFARMWGKDVGGAGVGICTVAANCQTGTQGGLGGEFNTPGFVATDAAGDVYVADNFNKRIEKFDSSGNFLRAWGKDVGGAGVGICTVAANCQTGTAGTLGGQFDVNGPNGIATDSSGNVYVAEFYNDRVQKFDSSGNFLRAWGKDVGGAGVRICTVAASCQAGTGGGLGGEFSSPDGVATDAAGNVYVTDNNLFRVQKFDSSGNFLRAWGKDVGGAGVGICTVAASCQAGTSGVQGGEFAANGPAGVATDAVGDVYVVNTAVGGRVQKFDSSGNFLRAWGKDVGGAGAEICTVAADCQLGASGGLGGEFSLPAGIATDAAGNVYVGDAGNKRVQKFGAPATLPRSSSTSVSCSPASVAVGSATACTATVSDPDAGTKTTPTGTVSFVSDSSGTFNAGGACTLVATGTTGIGACAVSYTPSAQGSGTHVITAAYAGDPTHATSNGATTVTVTTGSAGGGGGGGSGGGGSGGGGSGGGGSGGGGVPVNVVAPSISGSPLPGKDLSCSSGVWSHAPTAFSYRWQRSGSSIAGAQAHGYTVQILDEAQALTCMVTASNPAGASAPASSQGVLVAVPGTLHCPKPSGRLHASQLGPLALGMPQGDARHLLPRFGVTHNRFDNFCLYAGWGIRVGYPSKALLASLPARRRSGLTGKIVLALTANPFYAVNGITPGVPVAAARRRLKLGQPFHIGLNYWYIAPAGNANAVLKVRHGVIQEVGLASRQLTPGRAAQKRFLSSFNGG